MKKTFIILILLFIGQLGYSQADCFLTFKISGKVNVGGINLDKIYLPSTAFLVGYESFDTPAGFYFLTLKSASFSGEFRSHLSSDFCMDSKIIIDRVFKKVKNYPIRITGKMKDRKGKFKPYELEIPTDKIQFVVSDNARIEIILPEIKL